MQKEEDYCTEYHFGIETLKYENQLKINYPKDTKQNYQKEDTHQTLATQYMCLKKIYDTNKIKQDLFIKKNSQ